MQKTTPQAPEVKQTAFRLEASLLKQLKDRARLEYTSVNTLVRQAIKEYLQAKK